MTLYEYKTCNNNTYHIIIKDENVVCDKNTTVIFFQQNAQKIKTLQRFLLNKSYILSFFIF